MELATEFWESRFLLSALKQWLPCVPTPMAEKQRSSLQLRMKPLRFPSGTFQSYLLTLDNLLFHSPVLFTYDLIFNYPTRYLECSASLWIYLLKILSHPLNMGLSSLSSAQIMGHVHSVITQLPFHLPSVYNLFCLFRVKN